MISSIDATERPRAAARSAIVRSARFIANSICSRLHGCQRFAGSAGQHSVRGCNLTMFGERGSRSGRHILRLPAHLSLPALHVLLLVPSASSWGPEVNSQGLPRCRATLSCSKRRSAREGPSVPPGRVPCRNLAGSFASASCASRIASRACVLCVRARASATLARCAAEQGPCQGGGGDRGAKRSPISSQTTSKRSPTPKRPPPPTSRLSLSVITCYLCGKPSFGPIPDPQIEASADPSEKGSP